MNDVRIEDPSDLASWSALHSAALLYAVVMGLPLFFCWIFLSSWQWLGLSYLYLVVAALLGSALYGLVRLAVWWEVPRQQVEDRLIITLMQRVCRLGRLSRWDEALVVMLIISIIVLLVLTPATAAEAMLPPVAFLLLGSLANAARLDVDDPAGARHRAQLVEKRDAREAAVRQARAAAQRGKIPTLRLADERTGAGAESVQQVVLSLRWSYTPYGAVRSQTKWYQVELAVNPEHYREFQRLDHTPEGAHYENYAKRPLALPDDEIRQLAWELELLARDEGYCRLDTAGLALALVQGIPYQSDAESAGCAEYPRYPLETLVDGVGNCGCHAILAAALLLRLGFDTLLIYIPKIDASPAGTAHFAVAIAGQEYMPGDQWYRFEGRKYYYVETTSADARLGEFPAEWTGRNHVPMRLR